MKLIIDERPIGDFFILGRVLGRGRFAVVKEATEKSTGKVYAAKIQKKRRRARSAKEQIVWEIEMHELCTDHPRFPTLYGAFETPTEIIIILDLRYQYVRSVNVSAAGGEIYPYCVGDDGVTFSENDVIRYLTQILEGIKFLHDNSFVHLDLKPQNILLSAPYPHGNMLIVDFGLSRSLQGASELRELQGTPDYVAPEILNFDPISKPTDMWNLGVLAFVMLTGISPFMAASQEKIFENIHNLSVDFNLLKEECSRAALEFITSLIRLKPKERLTADECLRHPWLVSSAPPPHLSLLTTPCSLSWSSGMEEEDSGLSEVNNQEASQLPLFSDDVINNDNKSSDSDSTPRQLDCTVQNTTGTAIIVTLVAEDSPCNSIDAPPAPTTGSSPGAEEQRVRLSMTSDDSAVGSCDDDEAEKSPTRLHDYVPCCSAFINSFKQSSRPLHSPDTVRLEAIPSQATYTRKAKHSITRHSRKHSLETGALSPNCRLHLAPNFKLLAKTHSDSLPSVTCQSLTDSSIRSKRTSIAVDSLNPAIFLPHCSTVESVERNSRSRNHSVSLGFSSHSER